MTTWQPLSRRSKGLQPDGPYEGVPDHLKGPLERWYQRASKEPGGRRVPGLQEEIANLLRMRVNAGWNPATLVDQLLAFCKRFEHEDKLLDLVDCRLHLGGETWADELEAALVAGASVWRVNDACDGLERRVSEELSETVKQATTPNGEASEHLREAWAHAYGRNGDPSDAWDHALKALESLLCPLVVPDNSRATLGSVLAALRNSNGKWHGSLPGKNKDYPVAPVVSALELLWPNPDRHGETDRHAPTEEEARTVVALAAALVQGHRETPLVFKDGDA